MNFQIVDIYGLSEILNASPHTIKKRWRDFPHFFVGMGKDLRSARFDVPEVLMHLKEVSQNVTIQRPRKKNMDRKIQISEKTVHKERIPNKIRSVSMGDPKEKRTGAAEKKDPFNLFRGFDKIPE